MILSCAAMKALEERAFADGVSADALMEEAGECIARAVHERSSEPGTCLAVFGKGNNGGDALVAARHLAQWGWNVHLIPAFPFTEWGPLARAKAELATGCTTGTIAALGFGLHEGPLVVLDGILGIGAKGPLRPPVAEFTAAINHLRANSDATIFALDLPTGLDADTGVADPVAVQADVTLTIGAAKEGLVADGAANWVGRLVVLPLLELSARLEPGDRRIAQPGELRALLPRRRSDTHKGDYGRVGIVAGSPGFLGAAALCAGACVRAGAGLVTLYAGLEAAAALSTMVPREVMVRTVASYRQVLDDRLDILAIGPGLGLKHSEEIRDLIRLTPLPAVVDADGLNILSADLAALSSSRAERVLTPHPGEMARLAPDLAKHERAATVRTFVERFPDTTLLLKGARTLVGRSDQPLSYNGSGTPGMATGGMGDVLTGVIAALMGQGLRGYDAARLGAWWCGRAGELALEQGGETEETLTPTRLQDFLAPALRELRA